MLVHPFLDAAPHRRPLADAVSAFSAAAALGAVEEVLRLAVACQCGPAVFGAEELAAVVAALIVFLAHEGFALLIAGRALPARAGEALAAGTATASLVGVGICGTRGRGSGTGFLRVAGAG